MISFIRLFGTLNRLPIRYRLGIADNELNRGSSYCDQLAVGSRRDRFEKLAAAQFDVALFKKKKKRNRKKNFEIFSNQVTTV